MLRDAILSDDLRAFITTAGGAFTQDQIGRMNRAGVRFWGSEGIPPEFTRRYSLGTRFFTIQHIQMSNNNCGCCDMPQSFMISKHRSKWSAYPQPLIPSEVEDTVSKLATIR